MVYNYYYSLGSRTNYVHYKILWVELALFSAGANGIGLFELSVKASTTCMTGLNDWRMILSDSVSWNGRDWVKFLWEMVGLV